jgi:hypothetical protein
MQVRHIFVGIDLGDPTLFIAINVKGCYKSAIGEC